MKVAKLGICLLCLLGLTSCEAAGSAFRWAFVFW